MSADWRPELIPNEEALPGRQQMRLSHRLRTALAFGAGRTVPCLATCLRRGSFTVALMLAAAGVSPAADCASAPAAPLLTLDTHLDSAASLARPGWDILQRHSVLEDGTQLDYPRMVAGGLTGGFFAVYTPQGPLTDVGRANARDYAIRRTLLIRETIAWHHDKFALALTADDARRIGARGQRVVYISMENSYPIGTDLSLLATFYSLGVRMIGPVHFQNNDLGDSSVTADGPRWHGLSPLGKQFVREANRLGMILDASHASDDVLDQMLDLSATPVILSHSDVRALRDDPRNVDDARMLKIAAKGGVIQLTPVSAFLIKLPNIPQREAARRELTKRIGESLNASPSEVAQFVAERREIDKKYPLPRATIDDFIEHVFYAIKLVGIEHVGIGGDMDGGGGVVGLEDVTDYMEITKRLQKRGYSIGDINCLWSGNILRVLRTVELSMSPDAHSYKANAAPQGS